MKIYFLSFLPCALTINDTYFGTTNLFERFAEVDLRDNLFIRFSPEHAQPFAFFLTENIRFSPPDGCEVYLLPDAIAVYAKNFPPYPTPLRIIAQARHQNTLATVYTQGEVQLALETEKGTFIDTLPPCFLECTLSFHDTFTFLRSPERLHVYAQTGARIFCEKVLDFTIDGDTLHTTLPLQATFLRRVECSYRLEEDSCTRIRFSICQAEDTPSIDLLPFAFLESVLIGANYKEMLATELIPDASKIQAYLGNFVAVVVTDNPAVCGIVKPKSPRLFDVVYFTITTENGKISDIRPYLDA